MPATCVHKLMTPTHLLIRELHLQPGNTGCCFQLAFLVGRGKSLKCCRCELKKNKSRGPLCLGTSACLVGWLWCRLPESERWETAFDATPCEHGQTLPWGATYLWEVLGNMKVWAQPLLPPCVLPENLASGSGCDSSSVSKPAIKDVSD